MFKQSGHQRTRSQPASALRASALRRACVAQPAESWGGWLRGRVCRWRNHIRGEGVQKWHPSTWPTCFADARVF